MLPITSTADDFNDGLDRISAVRKGIFSIFKHFENFDPHPEILFISNFYAHKQPHLGKFTEEEINSEIKKLIDEGLLKKDDSRFTLTDKGQDTVFRRRR